MKKIYALVLLLCLASPAFAQDQGAVKRGAYIARLGDCTACHSVPGHDAFAGGLPMNSPYGIIYSTNITPDKVHGIGAYKLDDFKRALREGVAKDGHHLYPAMPYPSFANMTDQDLADLYVYFMHGVAPSAYQPPPTRLPFPLNQRWGLAIWNFLFAAQKPFQPHTDHNASWNRGAYLVEGLGHCGSCHTPRTVLYNEEGYTASSRLFLTGEMLDNWYAVNLCGDSETGLGNWDENEIATYLKTGHGHNAAAFGAMTQVIEDSTQYFSDNDLQAVAHYLKNLTPQNKDDVIKHSAPPLPPTQDYPMEQPGAGLYQSLCANCHQPSGGGHLPLYPALRNNPVVAADNPASLIHLVLEGGTTAQTTGQHQAIMPGFANLTDQQIGEVLSYIRSNWGNHAAPVSLHTIAVMRHNIAKDNAQKAAAAAKADAQ